MPTSIGDNETEGVFAAQPSQSADTLDEQARFLEMVANLMGQSVRLARRVQDEQQRLRDERDNLRRRVKAEHGFPNVVGHIKTMQGAFEQVRQVAKWTTTVLIRAEFGTGKDLIANAIHYNSPRANGPFVKLNCAALPDNLLESELFGHEKCAFTGAVSQRKGRLEQANSGTIFLDEIGAISPGLSGQAVARCADNSAAEVGTNVTRVHLGAGDDIVCVDPGTASLFSTSQRFRGDLVNFIPPQQAGGIARRHGLADHTGWCPVDASTGQSLMQPGVYVLGDAAGTDGAAKSAASARLQALRCARHLAGWSV